MLGERQRLERRMVQDDKGIPVRLEWSDATSLPIMRADQVSIMFMREGEFILTLGQVSPPVLSGSESETQAQAEHLDRVAIRPLARLGLSRATVAEFASVLQQNLTRHDALFPKGSS